MKFILASKSPRRKEILEKINIEFKIVDSKIDEALVSTTLEPSHYCMLLAKLKSSNVSLYYKDYTVIGADTIVVINDKILNKPNDKDEAKKMLLMLSGKTHQVITGVSLRNRNLNINRKFHQKTSVKFYDLHEKNIDFYIKNYSPLDKAGSYGIQDYGATFIEKINGSYENVMGFPIGKFFQILKTLKL